MGPYLHLHYEAAAGSDHMYGYEAAARRSGSYIHLQAAARSGATVPALKQQQNLINFFEILVDKAGKI